MIPKPVGHILRVTALCSLLGIAGIGWTDHAAASIAPERSGSRAASWWIEVAIHGYVWAPLIAVGAAALVRKRAVRVRSRATPQRRSSIREILQPPSTPPTGVSVVRPQPIVPERFALRPMRRNIGDAIACETVLILAQWQCDESEREPEVDGESDDEESAEDLGGIG